MRVASPIFRVGMLLLGLTPLACTVLVPPGYPTSDRPATEVRATPGVVYGQVPRSWEVPGLGQVLVDMKRAEVFSQMGMHRVDVAFTVSLGDHLLRCETSSSKQAVPESRFGCRSDGASAGDLVFSMAKGAGCPARDMAYVGTLTTPECWDGEVQFRGQRISLWHGALEPTGLPVGYLSFGQDPAYILLSADIVRLNHVRLFGPDHSVSPDLARGLVLLTIALHQWEHIAVRS